MDMRAKTCCFTGHRSLNGAEKLKVAVRLRKVIKELVKQGIVKIMCSVVLQAHQELQKVFSFDTELQLKSLKMIMLIDLTQQATLS